MANWLNMLNLSSETEQSRAGETVQFFQVVVEMLPVRSPSNSADERNHEMGSSTR